MTDPARELTWLRRLRDLSHLLATQEDVRALLPMILDAATERGFLVRVGGGSGGRPKVRVEVARGFARESLSGSQGKVSRTVVERALSEQRVVLTTSEADADVREVSSVQARRVLSILCVPLPQRGEVTGVLYLDHRFTPTAFTEQDVPVVEAFADQAALALETAARTEEGRRLEQARRELAARAAEGGEAEAAPAGSEGAPAPDAPARFGGLIGGSPLMVRLYHEIERAARSRAPVLITGESGTGKELVAREIHRRGPSAQEPFLSENCAAIADALLESELFGHRQGAFTGATEDRPGLFQLAGRGTLLLDEVGDMSPVMQSKLLRVLQEGCARPVGGERPVEVRCRVVAATLHDLRALVEARRFREDLYYRLDVLRIEVPPLRRRPEDVPALLEHFLAREAPRPPQLTTKATQLLVSYAWPGNVRELENEARRLASLGVSRLTARHLSEEVRAGKGLARADGAYSGKTLGEVEREMVAAAMRESGGNKARAARQLGIPKTTLYHLLDRYGLR